MEKLTRKERRRVYLKAAKMFITEESSPSYVCGELERIGNIERTPNIRYADMVKILFPEFELFRPNDDDYVWWTDDEFILRQTALLFCAEMCKTEAL